MNNMNQSVHKILLILVLHKFCACVAIQAKPSGMAGASLGTKLDKGKPWTITNSGIPEEGGHLRLQRQVDPEDNHSNHIGDDLGTEGDGKQKQIKPPTINFYSSISNAVGVFCNGMLELREISATLGTPLPIWVGFFPMLIFTIGIIFWPDFTTLGLPLFYPNGADGDPLAAFPPIPDLDEGVFSKLLGDLLPWKASLGVEIK